MINAVSLTLEYERQITMLLIFLMFLMIARFFELGSTLEPGKNQ